MYEAHFGFSGPPFQLVPDPGFFFGSQGHSNALAFLSSAAQQGDGFLVVTGEIGAGKTTLVRTLLAGLDAKRVVATTLVSTQLTAGELPAALLLAFGVPSTGATRTQENAQLEAYLGSLAAQGQRALLIVDEAQNLDPALIEELRMLSNLQAGPQPLLQVFLVGQPELRTLLQAKEMEQLRQRVTASCHLGPLDPDETRAYVEHRLHRVGWSDRPAIEFSAYPVVHEWTSGIPRRINRLCNRVLLAAFLEGKTVVTAAAVEQIARELSSEIGESPGVQRMQPSHVDAPRTQAQPVAAPPPPATAAAPVRHAGQSAARDAAAAPGKQNALGAQEPHAAKITIAAPSAAHAPAKPADVVAAHEVTPPRSKSARAKPRPVPAAVKPASRDPQQVGETEAKSDESAPRVAAGIGHPASEPVARPAPMVGAPDRTPTPQPRQVPPAEPVLLLVDCVTEYVKARALARSLAETDDLPPVVIAHTGSAASLQAGEDVAGVMPRKTPDIHLDINESGGAASAALAITRLDAVLRAHRPRALIAFGASDTLLMCALFAHKSGVAVLRSDAGRRRVWSRPGEEMNAVLLEHLADCSYISDLATYYTLYRAGIATDRVLLVGNLADNVVHLAAQHTVHPGEILRRSVGQGAGVFLDEGYALCTAQVESSRGTAGEAGELASMLMDAASQLPIVWAVNALTLHELESTGRLASLKKARVEVIPSLGYLDCVDLLRAARCLLSGTAARLLDDALALGLPCLVLGRGMVVPVKSTEALQLGAALGADQLGQALSEILANPPELREISPFWDGGAATRIATHLAEWLPRLSRAGKPGLPVVPGTAATARSTLPSELALERTGIAAH